MVAALRNLLGRILPESLKYSLSMSLSHLAYFFMKVLKGTDPIWTEDKEFMNVYNKIKHRSLMDIGRAYNLWMISKMVSNAKGDIIEIGAYRCASALLLSVNDTVSSKKLYIVDSFDGLPSVSPHDPYWKEGDMGNTDFEEIKNFLNSNLVNTPYEILQGFFPQDIELAKLEKKWSLVHVDTDLYQPTVDVLNFFYSRISQGGVIVVDDFGNLSCPGVKKAVFDFAKKMNIHPIYLVTGQALIVK